MNYCFLLSLQLLRLNFSKVLRVVIKGGERSVHLAIFSGKNPLSPMSIWFLTKYLTACQSLPTNAPFAFKIQFLQSNFPGERLSLTNELGCLKTASFSSSVYRTWASYSVKKIKISITSKLSVKTYSSYNYNIFSTYSLLWHSPVHIFHVHVTAAFFGGGGRVDFFASSPRK